MDIFLMKIHIITMHEVGTTRSTNTFVIEKIWSIHYSIGQQLAMSMVTFKKAYQHYVANSPEKNDIKSTDVSRYQK